MTLEENKKNEENFWAAVDQSNTEAFLNSPSAVQIIIEINDAWYHYLKLLADEHASNSFPKVIDKKYEKISYFPRSLLGVIQDGDWEQWDLIGGKRNAMTANLQPNRQYERTIYKAKKTGIDDLYIMWLNGNHDESVEKNSGIDISKRAHDDLLPDWQKGPYRTEKPQILYAKDRGVAILIFDDPLCPGRKIPYVIEASHGDKSPRGLAQADNTMNHSTLRGADLSVIGDSHVPYVATGTIFNLDEKGNRIKQQVTVLNEGTNQISDGWNVRMGFPMAANTSENLVRIMLVPDKTGKKSYPLTDMISIDDIITESFLSVCNLIDKDLQILEKKQYGSALEKELTYKHFKEVIIPTLFEKAHLDYKPKEYKGSQNVFEQLSLATWSGLNIGQNDVEFKEDDYEIFKKPMKGKKKDEDKEETTEELKVKKIGYVLKDTSIILDIKEKIEVVKKLGSECKVFLIGDFFSTIDIAIMKNLFARTDYCNAAFAEKDEDGKNYYIYNKLAGAVADLLMPIADNIKGFYIGIEEGRAMRTDGVNLMAMLAEKLGKQVYSAEEYERLSKLANKDGDFKGAVIDNNMNRLMSLSDYGSIKFPMHVLGTNKKEDLEIRLGYSKTLGGRAAAEKQIGENTESKKPGARVKIVATRTGGAFMVKGMQTIRVGDHVESRNDCTIGCGNFSNPNSAIMITRLKLRAPTKMEYRDNMMYKDDCSHLQSDWLNYETILLEKNIDNTVDLLAHRVARSEYRATLKFENESRKAAKRAYNESAREAIKKAIQQKEDREKGKSEQE